MSGLDHVIKKIDGTSNNVKDVVTKALENASKYPEKDMLDFIKRHRFTGITEESFEELKVKWSGNRFSADMGFDADKGGVPAVFLDKGTTVFGTPRIKPSFFIYYAFANNWANMHREVDKATKEIVEGLK